MVELMPQVVQWPPCPGTEFQPGSPEVETCRHHLTLGEFVALPTEAGYVAAASGLHPDAVARLAGLRTDPDGPLPAVVVPGDLDARDWVPSMGPIGRRFARRGWPGPLTLVCADGVKEGIASRLPDGVLRTLAPGWKLGLTAPRHPAVQQLLDCLSFPLVLGELVNADGRPANSADAVRALLGDTAAVVVDAGPVEAACHNTVVEIDDRGWTLRREGMIPAEEIGHLAAKVVLFVCTGNTCRSPLATVLCQKQLADRLGCMVDELPSRGYVVASAGLAAMRGEPAAAEAVNVARDLGADLTGHASRPATADLLAAADVIVGMTAGHLGGLAGAGGPETRTRLLCGDADLADPIGGDVTVYQTCAATIWQHLPELVDEMVSGEEQTGAHNSQGRVP
jgi:L-threonylcarbamoyladenylate synthase